MSLPQLELEVDRDQLAGVGLSARDVALALGVLAGGWDIADYNDEPGDGERYRITSYCIAGPVMELDGGRLEIDLSKGFQAVDVTARLEGRQGGEAIASFIGVINDITDRINLLSLNAAIEAARAGEHGRGFAVVADEIGKLALATSDNAKEISDRVGRIGADIERGVHLVRRTLDAIGEVLALIEKSGGSIDSVRRAMKRQDEYIGAVGEQSEKLDGLSKSILTSTGEQQSSMLESATSIQKIAELAQTIAAHNQQILDTADIIGTRATEMRKMMEDIRGVGASTSDGA